MRNLYKEDILLLILLFAVGWANAQATNNPRSGVGALNGVFSVSDSTQVRFSQGNLQYIGSAVTPYWKFADHQWECLGDNGQGSESQTVDRDLFCWGTSGYDHGANCYQPWSTSTNYSDYYAYGIASNNLFDGNGQADWGYNAISNGGNTENSGWRTLTRWEWNYVFNTRSTASGIRFAKANVEGVNGVILLPDNWMASIYALNSTNDMYCNYETNTITAADWTNTLEANGAAFLPAAGLREGISVNNVGSYGYYWSSLYGHTYYVYILYFNNNYLDSFNYYPRGHGRSVRLVMDAEPEPETHTHIDLGLPSGTLWATCNVGANAPEEFGDYFAWGETQTKDNYSWSTYQYCNGSENTLTKYCNNSSYGYNGFTDDLTVLQPDDDAAMVNWGADWRMPTVEQWQELMDNTTNEWITQNGVYGRLFTATNGNSLFVPASGYRMDDNLNGAGGRGDYWTSSLGNGNPFHSWNLVFQENECRMSNEGGRSNGQSVRPVRSVQSLVSATANPAEGGTITGAGSYEAGATCNLIATPAEGYTFVNWTENGVAGNGRELNVMSMSNITFQENAIYGDLVNPYQLTFTSNRAQMPLESSTGHGNVRVVGTHWTFNPYMQYNMTLTGVLLLDGESMQNNPRSEYLEIGAFCGDECRGSYLASLNPAPFAQGYFYVMQIYSEVQSGEEITFRIWDHQVGEVVSTENPYTFTVTGDRMLVANFEESITYLTSLSDDFNDGVIDPELWTYTGNAVLEEEGLLKLQQNVTDQDVHLRSVDLSIPENGKVNMNRRFLIHRASNYYHGRNIILLNGDWESSLRLEYVYTYHYDGSYQSSPKTGVYFITRFDGVETEVRLCDFSFDTWLTEYVEVDFAAGTLSYYLDSLVAEVPIPGLAEQSVSHYNVQYAPWGWWTGHYHNMDYVNINPLSEGLIAYYPFDGDANDYSGNEYHATPYNNYQYEDGLVGESIAVEGQGYMESSGGHVMLPQYDFDASSGITLSLWVNALGLTSSDGEAYINLGDHSNADGLYILQNTNTVYFQYHNSNVAVPYLEDYTGNWVMYTMTCGSDGKLKAYINGAFVGEEDVEYNGQINTSLAALGRHWWYNNGATSTRFIGSFDEVRIYNRAISPEEVQMLYGYNVIEITATANPEEGGTVSGAGLFNHGDTCTLTATPNASYTFINWTENGEVVSTEATYSFTVTSHRELVANFEGSTLNPEEDLVAYYPFDGDVNDYSGNGNHGIIIGNVVPATDRHGNPNGAYRFPGEAFNYISVPDAECLHLSNFTLSAWVYTDADNYGSGYLINKGRDINNGSYHLTVSSVSAFNDYYGENGAGVSENPQTHEWHMITGTVEGDQARYYLDGVLMDERTLSNPFSYSNSEPLTLGCHYYSGVPSYWAYTLLGVMDEVRIYSRVFTPQEVMQLYNYSEGSLSGLFSVSETTQVNFSKGNLQYQASTNTWRFAENQWDCVGADNANISETYDGWIDLFGWGTSGYDHGANAYQPWSTSQNNSDYWAYGDSGASLSDYTGQADWGYNAISNGGNQEGLWHTLSHSEWDYLINNRPASTLNGVENARHAKAVVNGIAGLILFPDHYSHPDSIAVPVNINEYASQFMDNEYTIEQWYEMEDAGAVFLPTAGIRSGGVPSIGSLGIYWSTTPSGSSFSHRFDFTTDYVVAWGIDSKWYGYSVRLVKNVLTTTCSIEAVPNPAEGGMVTGAGTYFVGETCTLTAIPNESYTFINWTENGEVVSTEATYSFTVTGHRELVANFIPVLASLSDDFNDGVIDPELWTYGGSSVYEADGLMKIEQNVTDDWVSLITRPMSLTPSGQILMERSFIVHRASNYFSGGFSIYFNTIFDNTSNTDVEPWIRVQYFYDNYGQIWGTWVNASIDGQTTTTLLCDAVFDTWINEKVIVDTETGTLLYCLDNELVATATIAGLSSLDVSYYTIRFWPYSWWTGHYHYMDYININMEMDATYTITASANPVEGGTVSEGGTFQLGQTCSLTATANEGYTFVNWTENGEVVSTEATYSFLVVNDRDLVANFMLPLNITASVLPEEGGSVTGVGEYDYGTECTLVATPNEDYSFVKWTKGETVVSTQSSYSFVVTEDADYVAHFILKMVGTVMAEYDPDPDDNQSPYVRVSWSMDSNLQEDFESGDFNMHPWEFTDSYPWVITDNNPYEGTFCMRSNNGGAHYTSSTVQTTMFIPSEGQMSFYSRISSESRYDYGRFYIDGQEMGNWSGSGGWEQHIYDITAGEHTFKWAYTKDGSVNSGEDCFYVDNINFFGADRSGNRSVHHYEVYRSEAPETGSWELLADNVSDTSYVDTGWSALAEGWYKYGVVAYYEGYDTVYPTYMARSNRILRAYPHTITATANPEEGGTIMGAGDYVLYTECTLTATANENYTFMYWTENGEVISSDATYSFTVITERDLVANFHLPFPIIASTNPEDGGTISGAGEYYYNSECTLTATANEDFYFVKWTRDGNMVSAQSTYSFIVTEEASYVAHFAPKPVGMVTATYDPDPEDNQSPYVRVSWNMDSSLREDFESGDFHLHPWEFTDSYPWVITDNNPYEGTFCMRSNNGGAHYTSSTVQTTMFIPSEGQMSFWSRVSSENNYDYGRFYIDGQEMGVWCGSSGWEQHIYYITAGEHTFKWAYTKDGSVNSGEDCFYVDNINFFDVNRNGNRSVHHYEVYRSEHPENGSWELLADNVTDTSYVDTGWSALTEGWYKYGVVVNYAGNNDTLYSSGMGRSNRILRANPHTITATANPEEGGTVEGTGVYIYDSECTLTANPNENCTFVNWTENGEVISTETTYTFTVTADRDLVANFTLPFTISVSAVPEEGGTVTGAGVYNIGTECTLTATANEGYEFMYWTENGTMVSSSATYSFTVTEDRTLMAYFAENHQAVTLTTGWTWLSTYIEQEGIDGLTMLEEGLGSNGVMIKSQTDGFLSYANGMWMGTLDAITNEKMYLVNTIAASEFTMTGSVAHLNDHPITLNPNWTWVGYPSPFAMDVNDALANLNPAEGDMMKSQTGFATYSAENGWFGSLNTLTPGMGLMYQSHNSQAVTLTYSVGMSRSLRANVTAENNHWIPNIHAYPNNMNIMAVVELDGVELQDERYELAVFSGDECRGSVRLIYVESLHRYVAFLSVAGEDEAELCLALYDTMTEEVYFNTKDVVVFEANAVLGSLSSPFVARFGSTTGLDGFDADAVILYPNPVTAGHLFQIELPAECSGARVSIIDALGSVVSTTDLYAKPATLSAPEVPGVYTVRVMTGKQGTYSRKLIVK